MTRIRWGRTLRRATISFSLVVQTLVAVLSFSTTAAADVFRIMDSDQEAAQIRVDMIQLAREEILLAVHRASDDELVLSYLALLRGAARRGVKVRFLIDGAFNELSKPIQAHLLCEGIEIKEYHPVRLTKLRGITQRYHDKVILVDRKKMLIGGRNLEYPFFGSTKKSYVKKAYVDRDVYVEGRTLEPAYDYFIRLWQSDEVAPVALGSYDPGTTRQDCDDSIDGMPYERCMELRPRTLCQVGKAEAVLDRRWSALDSGGLIHKNPNIDWSIGQREVADVRFFHDPVGRKGIDPGTFEAFLDYVDSAKASITIESPYFILSKNSSKALARAIVRGVRVRVLTNSLASTQNLFAQGGYEGEKAQLVQMGIEIWEYKGPKMLHAKSIVIDDEIAIIGNFNIDPRSEFLNTELAVAAHDDAVARELRLSMDAHLANAWLIGRDGMAEGESRRFPNVSTGKIIKLRFFQMIAPLVKKQL